MAKQTHNMRGYDYEMPPELPYDLACRKSFEVMCRSCERVTIANIVNLLAAYGPAFESTWLERRGRCAGCGVRGKLWVFRGCHRHLMPIDEFPLIVVADGSDWWRPDFLKASAADRPPWDG